MTDHPQVSVVLPCFNEEGNLRPLVQAVTEVLESAKVTFEIIVTDDCSRDNSWNLIKEMAAADPRIRARRFVRNFGQSAALWAGLKEARGRFLVTLDADLQNDPKELPRFLAALEQFDCVCGSRVESRRQGDSWVRVLSSRIANSVRNRLSGETISDSGCCYRAFKRECIADLKFFKGMHRFMPTLIRMEGFSVTEIPVATNRRFSGRTNYGVWNRLFASFYDLLAVRWMKKRMFRFQIGEKVN